MNLPLPSADKIISKSKATKTVKGVWDKTTASLEMNMAKAQDAMASYQSGKLHDPDKFTCAFFKFISPEKDLIQLHFKGGGMMVGLNDDGDTTLRVKGADAASTLNAWDSYISSLKIDQDDFAKRIHQAAIAKAKPKPKEKGMEPACHFDKDMDMWVMDE